MTAAAVQTCAQEPDMFGAPEPEPAQAAQGDLVMEFRGRLVSHAVVSNKLVDHGTQVRPVLCLDVAPIGDDPFHQRIHAEQVFTEARRKEAEALAATLKRGTHITFRTTLVDRRVTFPRVQSVAVIPPT